MHLSIVTPAPRGSHTGNRITAERWARLLRELGHRVTVSTEWTHGSHQVLIALHARRSASAIAAFAERHPGRPRILAMTGTDIYRDLAFDDSAQRSVELADRIVLLNGEALDELSATAAAKATVILQSAVPADRPARVPPGEMRIVVVGHLRPEKDPFRALEALDRLPERSAIRILHLGAPLDEELGRRAAEADREHPRYRWTGDVPHAEARRLIASAEAMVLSSIMEGGANVISEAVVNGVPVIASRIPSSVALLGEDYPAWFEAGDTEGLARLLRRFEREPELRNRCRAIVRRLAPKFSPARERKAWRELLKDVSRRRR